MLISCYIFIYNWTATDIYIRKMSYWLFSTGMCVCVTLMRFTCVFKQSLCFLCVYMSFFFCCCIDILHEWRQMFTVVSFPLTSAYQKPNETNNDHEKNGNNTYRARINFNARPWRSFHDRYVCHMLVNALENDALVFAHINKCRCRACHFTHSWKTNIYMRTTL